MNDDRNEFDIYFNNLGDAEIDELSGFFKKIKKKLKKVVKKAAPILKKIAPVAAFIPGIGPAVAPILAAVSKGGVAATAVNLLKNTPIGANVVKKVASFAGSSAMKAVVEMKPELVQAFNAVVSPSAQQKINKAVATLKMQGKSDDDVLGQFLRSDIFKSISTQVTQKVTGEKLASTLKLYNVPPEMIAAEVQRKSPIVAVAATEKIAEQSKKPISIKESVPFISLAIALARML